MPEPLPSVVASTSQAISRGGFSAVQSASDRVDSLRVPGATLAVGKRGKQRGGLGLLLLAQVTDPVALSAEYRSSCRSGGAD